jgi:hypothetical protein
MLENFFYEIKINKDNRNFLEITLNFSNDNQIQNELDWYEQSHNERVLGRIEQVVREVGILKHIVELGNVFHDLVGERR